MSLGPAADEWKERMASGPAVDEWKNHDQAILALNLRREFETCKDMLPRSLLCNSTSQIVVFRSLSTKLSSRPISRSLILGRR